MAYKPLDPREQIAADVYIFIKNKQDMLAIGRLINALCDEYDEYEGFDRANFLNICLKGEQLMPKLAVVDPTDKWDEIDARMEFNAEHDPGLGDD